MARAKKGPKDPPFEQALERLETIVKDLEDGDRPLEESLRLFEEGVRLTRLCAGRLDEAQRKIEMLARGEQGELKVVPFEAPEGEAPAGEDDPDRT